MSQIVKRKKKGRPLKVDRNSPETEDRDIRRSLRPRNVKYVFDLDDYFDDELFEDDEDHRQREKKLKHLLKRESSNEPVRGRNRRVGHAPATSASSSDEDIQKPSKKRKIYNHFDDDDSVEFNEEEDEIVRDRMAETKAEEYSPPEAPSRILLPDKKVLELILDKLQKKDIYGVYAEPVDPEELPDYHELIENPMDFATVRNNLRNGSYITLDQFESDVFLICSNAMQYNEPVTVYYKQARSIQELAKKKFDKLRLNVEYSEKVRKPEKKVGQDFIPKKRIGRPVRRALQEPVVSDFSSGATPATPVDLQNVSSAYPSVRYERPRSVDRPVWEGSLVSDNNIDKGEELLAGKGQLGRSYRKSFIADENRRATYDISLAHPMASSESIFSTFEEESKQLVPVGLYSDHSYARSLARFAATLGSDAWQIASRKIEQVLPEEFKFGRGWVGDYEPLPTPVLIQENCIVKEPPFLKKEFRVADPKKIEKIPMAPCSSKENSMSGMLPLPGPSTIRPPSAPTQHVVEEQHARPNVSEAQQPIFRSSRIEHCASPNLNYLLQNSQPMNSLESDKKILQQAPSFNRIFAADPAEASRSMKFMSKNPTFSKPGSFKHVESSQPTPFNITDPRDNRQVSNGSETEASRSTEFTSRSAIPSKSGSFKHVELNRLPSLNKSLADTSDHRQMSKRPQMEASRLMEFASNFSKSGFSEHDSNEITGGLPNGKHTGNSSSSGMANTGHYYPNEQGQGLSDPVQLMKMLAERSHNQQKSTNQSMESRQAFYSAPPSNVDANNAAARVWMSVGAGGGFRPNGENSNMQKNLMYPDSMYNSTRDHSMMQFQVQPSRNNMQNHSFAPMRLGNEVRFQNPQMVFPQRDTADLSSFQMQPTWQNITPQIQRQKPEMLPPDLNIGFHPSGSPSGVFVDSQQPDLALQL